MPLTSERTLPSWAGITPFCLPPWQCTVTCGGGVQTRSVHCVQQGRPSSSCLLHQKPPVLRACNTNFCPAPEKRGKGSYAPSISPVLRKIFRSSLWLVVQRMCYSTMVLWFHQHPWGCILTLVQGQIWDIFLPIPYCLRDLKATFH